MHGQVDALADDIFCLPDGPRVLDCLDFDPGLRHGDVLGDVATLAMRCANPSIATSPSSVRGLLRC